MGLAMLTGACLTPPGVATQQSAATVLAEQHPREFVHSSGEILKGAVLGWNLGNSLDAAGGETGWGNPPATLELMKGVAKAGFGLVRIPVTWTSHMGAGPDYVIEPAWLKRVAEVVGTLMAKTHTWGQASPGRDDWGQEDFVVKQFDKLKTTYIDKGIPVFLGEYGAVNHEDDPDYRRYYMEYVTKAAIDRGILPVYWDNGAQGSGEDKFAMFDRNSGEVVQPKLLEAMRRAATSLTKLTDIALPKPAK